jgi:hypothetical protein
MSNEQRLREVLDAFVARVREDLEALTQSLAADLTHALEQAQAADRHALDERLAGEQAVLAEERAERERVAAADRETLDHRREQLDAEHRALEERLSADRITLEAERQSDRQALDQRLEAERQTLAQRIEDERQASEGRLAGERSANDARMAAHRHEQAAALRRLLDGIRRLDAASSLSAALETLARCALAQSSRVVIFIVEGDRLKSWGHFGFEPGQGAFDVTIAAVTIVHSALATKQSTVFRAAEGDDDPSLPPFMRPPAGHVGLVAPLVVGGEVVAVLYADGVDPSDDSLLSWAEEVELLARHARARLESLTSERTWFALTRTA